MVNDADETSSLPSTSLTRSARKRRNINLHHSRQRTWATALTLAAILSAQESTLLTVTALQPVNRNARQIRPLSSSSNDPQPPSSSRLFGSSSVLDDSLSMSGLRWGHERSTSAATTTMTIQGPSRMFLTAAQVSNQPMSALSSNFFDSSPATTATTTVKPSDEELLTADQYYQTTRRSRGVLGFCLPDHGDHVISSSKTPPLVEDSSTCLHSSTERQTPSASSSSSFSRDFETWSFSDTSDEDEWLSLSNSNSNNNNAPQSIHNNNPILNRSPNANIKESTTRSSSDDSLAWFPWMPTISQIEALKVSELRKICSDRGLKQAGNKVDLQQRLWDWTRQQQHRQRRLMIGSSSANAPPKTFRLESKLPKTRKMIQENKKASPDTTSSANSLGEWARTYDIEPLLQKREKIHKEKREGKAVNQHVKTNHRSPSSGRGAPDTPTKEYLSKLFEAPSSQYSNFEVKQMYAAAKSADQSGDRALSRQILYKLKEATPHDARIYRRLARMESEEGSIHNARQVLQEGLRLHPSNPYIWHGLGQLELKAGNDNEARSCFGEAIKLDPAFPNAYHAWGIFEHSNGHIARAMKILKNGLEYCPTNHRLHHALGDLYREAKMLDMAEKSFRRSLEHGPKVSRPFAYTSLSRVAYELGEIDSCRSWLKKAVAINNGRHAKGWLTWARFEESEMNLDAARSVCVAALNQYEKCLLEGGRKGKPGRSNSFVALAKELSSTQSADPAELKNQMLKSVPRYRSGDHFLKVYRNWIRLEERHGTPEAVDYVYTRATNAFSYDWKLTSDWARYHARNNRNEQARSLFSQACCDKASNKHAEPFRLFAEFEMNLGNYAEARKILYRGALALSDSPDGGLDNQAGGAELYYTWAICEWRLNNLSRSEVLFDHSLRLASPGNAGSILRSGIFYALARLEYELGETHLAQHCICLCLKENSIYGGNSKVWELWAEVARAMGQKDLAKQCFERALAELEKAEDDTAEGLSLMLALQNPDVASMKGTEMQSMMRNDPWHYKLYESSKSEHPRVPQVSLPGGN